MPTLIAVVVAVDGHGPGDLGRGGDPAQAEPRQRERLRHAADGDATRVQVRDGRGRPVPGLVDPTVDLVAQDPRPDRVRDVGDLAQAGLVEEGARRVVGVGEGDELRATGRHPAQLREIQPPTVRLVQCQRRHLGAEALRDRGVLLVRGHDGDDAIARLHQRLVDEVVGPDRSVGDDHIPAANGRVQRSDRVPQAVRTLDRAVGELQPPELGEERGSVDVGERQELADGQGLHAGLGQVEAAPGLPPVHPGLDTELTDLHGAILRWIGREDHTRATCGGRHRLLP